MKLNGIVFEFEGTKPSEGYVEISLDSDGELVKVDVSGELFPEDLASALKETMRVWAAAMSKKP